MAGPGTNDRIRMVCAACSSEDVTRDAWVAWDVEAQDWYLHSLLDRAVCHRCRMSTHIEARPLD